MQSTALRRSMRGLALLPAVLVLTATGPAFAEPPATWEESSLPSMIGGQRGDAALAFRDNPEWFGGPRQGVEAAPDDASEPQGRGGTSAHW